jgi:periplasmic copper chaperone A
MGDDMRARSILRTGLMLAAAGLAGPVAAAGKLKVEGAWVRTAPPDAAALAGYAVLRNVGDAAVILHGASSPDFATVSIHETFETDGVQRMQSIDTVEVVPDASVVFAPGGKHLMLMRPLRSLSSGAVVKIHFDTNDSDGVDASFIVRDDAPDGH